LSIEAAFRLAIGVFALLAVGMCLVGYGVGVKARGERGRIGVAAFLLVLVLGVVGGAFPLTLRFGKLVMMEAVALTVGLAFAMTGGFDGGQKRKAGRSPWISAMLPCLLVTAIALGYIANQNQKLLEIVKELGIDGPKQQKAALDISKNCTQSLAEIYKGFEHYAGINDALPPAEKWLDEEDFLGGVQANEWLHCPAVSSRKDAKYGYAYNEALAGHKLSGKSLKEMPDAAKTPLVFDSDNLAKNAHDKLTSLPKPGRHGGTNNILYCDGHIEAVAPK
jgi:prepilin-type processing-associated H-X9-DG protein